MSGYANDEAALMQVDITGDQPVVSLTAGRVAVVRDPRWSPDGRRVAYIRLAPGTGTDSVLTVDAQGRDGRGVPLADGEYALHLDWSARGRLAALVRGPGTRTRWWSCTRTGRP
jgi:Tol biopolymer transport system component